MRKLHLVSTAMLIPAIIFAEINFHLSIGNTHSACEYEVEAEYVDDGDPWFEEYESSGPARVSFEYQWSIRGGAHVLRYRRVTFHTIDNSWVFGPWMIKVNYCHHSCNLHHKHVFYRPVVHANWHRVYDRSKKIYIYEYRNPAHDHRKQIVYRHEYKPVYKKQAGHDRNHPAVKHKEKQYHHKQQSHDKKYEKPNNHRKHDQRSDNQSGKLNKSSSQVKKEQGKNQQGKIVLVSGRNK
ncbi:MAG: hypothetical protein GX267_00905 [Fibrobacter sp.]|jgi:hypothetical protein|nr:hypothetical protein [Fibrobacter sp.]